jgi:hypothetical protein
LEFAADASDAGRHPLDRWRACTEDDEMGPAAALGQRRQDSLQHFNARSEEFKAKPAFRDAWKRGQRCLIVTDGFYEWKKLDPKGKQKQAYAIAMAGGVGNVKNKGPQLIAPLDEGATDPRSPGAA